MASASASTMTSDSTSMDITQTLWSMVSEACCGMQIEIAIFALAIFVHTVLFNGKFNPSLPLKGKGKAKSGSSSPRECSPTTAALMKLMEGWKTQHAASSSISEELVNFMQTSSADDLDEALVDTLESQGRQLPVEAALGVRSALQQKRVQPSAQLSEALLRSLQQNNKFPEACALLAEIEAAGIQSYSITLLALRLALKRSDAKTAVKHLCDLQSMWQEKTTSSAPASLMQQVAKLAAESGEMPFLVQQMQDVKATPQMLSAAIIEAARVRDKEACRALWAIAHSPAAEMPLCSDAYACLLKAARTLEEATEIFKVTEQLGLRTVCHYNALLDVCVENGSLKTAKQLMNEAVEKKVADVVTYNTMIKAYLKAGDFKSARSILDTMRTAGVHPNAVSFNELLDAALSESASEMWAVIDEMKVSGQRPNNITCSILLKGVQQTSRGSDVEKTMAVVDAMEGDMDEILLSSVVEACVRAGRADLLMPLLKRQQGPSRVPVRGAHTYGSMIRAYGYLNDISSAWQVWEEMSSRGIKATSITVGCMVEALVSNNQTDRAYDLIHEMQKQQAEGENIMNVVIYCSVLKGFSHQKRFDRVWAVYQEMLEDKLEFSIVTYNALIDACARSSEMKNIPSILQDMEKQGVPPNLITYSTIVKGYCQENKLDKACQVVDSMKKATNFIPDEIMYNSLLDGCARRGLYDRGMAILQEMQDSGIKPSNFTLSILAKLASRGKSVDAAFDLCSKLAKENGFRFNTHVYNNLIHACVQHRNMPRALQVFKEFAATRLSPDARTFAVVVRGCLSSSDWCTAIGLVRLALQLPGEGLPMTSVSVSPVKDSNAAISGLVNELLEGLLAADDNTKDLAVQLLHDLKRRKQSINIDSRLKMKFTTSAMNMRSK
eukprot:CAMPEP_0178418196 /NCGR_PEP_ID=MMETSP0689_2-20121128/24963_1 /TAXON_ID=160604 /ORGANISM="Amphidinium massartii, Strain CS-259" /LENGTH=893 /DNA_ID=CAMNT_0020039581 /DNA_START=89 /DNA_END=2770 /DNA_ORIENTATION=+